MNSKLTYHKDKLTKLLLAVALFLSIFTFSGYAGNSQSRQQLVVKTELVFSTNYKICRSSISYKKASEPIYSNFSSISFYKNWTNTLFAYDILTKLKLDSILRQACPRPVGHFLQVKTIPQSSDEGILSTFAG